MEEYEQELLVLEEELAVVDSELQDLLERQSQLMDRKTELEAIISQQAQTEKQKKNKAWDGTDFPWTQEMDDKLTSVFKLHSLRPMQRQTMNATLSGEDCLLIMPTGGGKSLCFQLPAMVGNCLTLVVSPLVSLMEDQQMALEELGVPAAMLCASSDKDRVKTIQDDMVNPNGPLRLLYVTPEKLAKSKRFMNRLEKCYAIGRLARLVIDEVHCCSQWGHDFRPDYKFLGIMKRQFPETPILGLTATATTKVLEDVKTILNIPHALLFRASFNRPNLFYQVLPKPSSQKETMEKILLLISTRFRGMSGIVYCFSRKDSEEVTSDLMSHGIKAGCYHGDIDAKSRSRVHRMWLSGEIQVVVATVAFGMGIDKPDVRFVIHHSISKSMENLYQESGRAGRDDKRSDCIVLYRLADVVKQSCMVFTEQTGLNNLHGIVKYCTDVKSCRRSVIARHFGEVWDSGQCDRMCDHCKMVDAGGSVEQRDVTRLCGDLLTLLDAAAATDQRVTLAKLIDAWYGRGASSLKVKSVPCPGVSQDKAERILAHMLVTGYLREDFHFTAYSTICYIVAGPKAKLLRNKVAKVVMDFTSKSGKSQQTKGAATSSSSSSSSSSLSSPVSVSSSSSSSMLTNSCEKSSSGQKEKEKKPALVVTSKQKSHPSPAPSGSNTTPSTALPPKPSQTTPQDSENPRPTSDKHTDATDKRTNAETSGEKNRKRTAVDSPSERWSNDDDRDQHFDVDDSDDDFGKTFVSKNSSGRKTNGAKAKAKSVTGKTSSGSAKTNNANTKMNNAKARTKNASTKTNSGDAKTDGAKINSTRTNGTDATDAEKEERKRKKESNPVPSRKKAYVISDSSDEDEKEVTECTPIKKARSGSGTGSGLGFVKVEENGKNSSVVISDDDDDDDFERM
ncbi:ATP-dependent DNA helicase Q1 [Aplysia californica]|uniref:ATP-dependent DNA helicase n=1 Tax=Aplysia californica TaxID=6500 RepID=A0ABM1ABI5_APLCA|nr:ATP-dependent DNA helicase Q1 [Aplysia californica]